MAPFAVENLPQKLAKLSLAVPVMYFLVLEAILCFMNTLNINYNHFFQSVAFETHMSLNASSFDSLRRLAVV